MVQGLNYCTQQAGSEICKFYNPHNIRVYDTQFVCTYVL